MIQKQHRSVSRRAFLTAGSGAVTAIAFDLRYGIKHVQAKAGTQKTVNTVEFADSEKRKDTTTMPVITKTDDEWKQQLSPIAFEITRRAGTERPYSGQYWNLHDKGLYRCICWQYCAFQFRHKV